MDFVTLEVAEVLVGETPAHLVDIARTGGVRPRAASLTPTYREATDTAVQVLGRTLVLYRAHRLFPGHLLIARTAQMTATGDVRARQAGRRLLTGGDTKGTGDEAHQTVMIEIDPLSAMIRHHAHLLPEEPADAIPLYLPAIPHARHRPPERSEGVIALLDEAKPDLLRYLRLARGRGRGQGQGLESQITGRTGGGRHLVDRKIATEERETLILP